MKQRALLIAKWLWLAVVLAAAVWYLARNGPAVAEQVRSLHPEQIGLSIACLVVTKLILTEITRRSLRPSQAVPRFRSCFYVNGVTQVAKYLPGGIWHFVGKFAYYRGMALTATEAGQAMLVENSWLVASAGFFGIILAAPSMVTQSAALPLALRWLGETPQVAAWMGFTAWLLVLVLIEFAVLRNAARAFQRSLSLLVLQAVCWFSAGLSFWALFPATARHEAFPLAVGAFSLAWVAGYLTIFAPGGIGAREAVLVVLLAGITPPGYALVLASIHRLLWTSAELLMGATAVIGGVLGVDWGVQPAPMVEASDSGGAPG